MDPKFQITENGQAVYKEDINQISENAALSGDRVLAELLRPPVRPTHVWSVSKAIIPGRVSGTTDNLSSTMIEPVPGGVRVLPGRAVVGASDDWQFGRPNETHGVCTAAFGDEPGGLVVPIQPNTGSLIYTRIDLVYVEMRIDVPSVTVSRKVKDPSSGVVQTKDVIKQVKTTATVKVANGYFGSMPHLPPDEWKVYMIPLAYLKVEGGYGAMSTLAKHLIWECSPQPAITGAVSASTLRSADGNWRIDGAVQQNNQFGQQAGRSTSYIPSTMVGEESLIIPVSINAYVSWDSISHLSGQVLDASRDWRNRIWNVTVAAKMGMGEDEARFPWSLIQANSNHMAFPDTNDWYGSSMGHSFYRGTNQKAYICRARNILNAQFIGNVDLYVDMLDGSLRIEYNEQATLKFIFWLRATSQFNNAFDPLI